MSIDRRFFCALTASALVGCSSPTPPAGSAPQGAQPAKDVAPKSSFLARAKHPSDTIWVAGQPNLDDLKAVKAAGIKWVVNMRAEGEPTGFSDEKATVEGLGLGYTFIPVAGAAGVTTANAEALKATLQAHEGDKILLHCASGNRVGALMALIAFDEGKTADEAMAIGKHAGMTALTRVVQGKLKAKEAARAKANEIP